MQAVNAIYVRMSTLLDEMGSVSDRLYREIRGLKDRLKDLHVSWQGEAFSAYSRVLMEDLAVMEITALDAILMYRILALALKRYMQMETSVSEAVGGLI
ncbi:MAG: hypothetical protein K5857_08725 [Lachnospiraceae bacterium]|nr:hypothetical protein [Lachnospiraceae bacterium]